MVSILTGNLARLLGAQDNQDMISPVVIAGFAVIDASVLGQLIYALASYERQHQRDPDARSHRAR
jgi:hypothetical protein